MKASQQRQEIVGVAFRTSVSKTRFHVFFVFRLTKSVCVCVSQSFAENTMNELLGWYGYDKVELRDSDNLELGETPQHISVLKGTSPKHCTGSLC